MLQMQQNDCILSRNADLTLELNILFRRLCLLACNYSGCLMAFSSSHFQSNQTPLFGPTLVSH